MLADLNHPLEAQVFTRERERLGTIIAIDADNFILAPLNIAHDKHVRRVPRGWVESVAVNHAYLNRSMADVLQIWTNLPPPDFGRLSPNMMVYASDGSFVGNFLRVFGLHDLLIRRPGGQEITIPATAVRHVLVHIHLSDAFAAPGQRIEKAGPVSDARPVPPRTDPAVVLINPPSEKPQTVAVHKPEAERA